MRWLAHDRIAAVHDDCLLEVHDLITGETKRFDGDGHGAAILRTDPPLIHGVRRHEGRPASSRLLAFADDALTEIGSFDGSYNFSASRDGRVLGRFDRFDALRSERPSNADLLISLAPKTVTRLDLGHYDPFNHFIRIDGAPSLFFLQGKPASSHERKSLCMVRSDGRVERLWPLLRHDGSHASHAMECCGCYIADDEGEGIILAGRHYDPNPSMPVRGFIYRKPIGRDRELWRLRTAAAATAILHIPARELIAAAFLDGTFMLLDAVTGDRIAVGQATVGGLDTVIFSMDARDAALAIGTFNGVVAVITVDELLAQNPDTNVLELG